MVDKDLIISKADLVKKHVDRALNKGNIDIHEFLRDTDRQDIVLFNIQMAVQNCLSSYHDVPKPKIFSTQVMNALHQRPPFHISRSKKG